MDSASVKQAIIRQVQTESNVANSRELFEAFNEHCFEKCVPKPGSSLSSGESSCVTMCMDKYLAAWNKVNASLLQRMQQENKAAGN
ncbi:mitochondrial import inner membrane translocase subunit TIM13 [Schizothecium vesticola]|uniref:Mitochondrial import inner membrane translocase subunit n=1 Tax=Schizothecium vesticola TaxID=314040 RepID=A0AA40F968_9PEZI|nr:mitochondrial import inner membrane translocase subunit TIM13 [Schizothecium vesticola]